jgi:hypothetical protein
MHPHNRKRLSDRVITAAEAALLARKYVSPIDVLVGIGWLDPASVKRWRQGQLDYLERAVQSNLPRISEAMKLFRSWASAKGLVRSESHYVAQTPSRQTLRFSKSANPTIEKLYRTHWISGGLPGPAWKSKQDRACRTSHAEPRPLATRVIAQGPIAPARETTPHR